MAPQHPEQANVEYWFRLLYELAFRILHLDLTGVTAYATHLWNWIVVVGLVVSVISMLIITYAVMKLYELRHHEHEELGPIELVPEAQVVNQRWVEIQNLVKSTNPNDWRQAIIEADIMLDEALMRQGYQGQTIGDRLKDAEPNGFATLQNAWEAHKVRNQIAHQGSGFELTESLARRTIAYFETVFHEFQII